MSGMSKMVTVSSVQKTDITKIEGNLNLTERKKVINMIIYLATNKVNGMQYIGQTKQNLKARANSHINDAKRKKSNTVFAKAIREYGAQNIIFDKIDGAKTEEELTEKEKYWVEKLNTKYPNGYNLQEISNNRYRRLSLPENIFQYDGVWFASIAEWSRYHKISVHIVRYRLKKGMTLQQIKETPVRPSKIAVDVGFRKFESWREACRYFNLCSKVVYARTKSGWTTREALGIDKRKETKGELIIRKKSFWKIQKNGKTYYGKKEIAQAFGIHKACLQSRLARGMPLEKAVIKNNPYEIIIEGVTYSSIAELAKQKNISARSVYDRLSRGFNLEMAVKRTIETEKAKQLLTQ